MQCLSPIYLNTPKGRHFVPCGKCNFCLSNRRSEWTFRLKNELKYSETGYFVTLTYSDENLPIDGALKKRDLQLFFKRLRKSQDNYLSKLNNGQDWPKIRYYACGEYGTKTQRAHYHAIIFNIHPKIELDLQELWNLGHSLSVPANGATIHYVTKYVINKRTPDVFALISKGLGDRYGLNRDYHRSGDVHHVISEGVPMRMPRYYRDKFFTSFEKQIYAAKTERKIREMEDRELQRLSNLVPNPVAYMSEARFSAHEKIKTKANSRNTF